MYKFLNLRGIQPIKPLLWWKSHVPPKIRAFMWLVFKKIIEAMNLLMIRGWTGDHLFFQFRRDSVDVDHLFFGCYYDCQIWMWISLCKNFADQWHSVTHIASLACFFNKYMIIAFLVVFGAVFWFNWKHQNEFFFNSNIVYSVRNTILMILSLVSY